MILLKNLLFILNLNITAVKFVIKCKIFKLIIFKVKIIKIKRFNLKINNKMKYFFLTLKK